MKKILTILSLLLFFMMFIACQKNTNDNNNNQEKDSEEITTPTGEENPSDDPDDDNKSEDKQEGNTNPEDNQENNNPDDNDENKEDTQEKLPVLKFNDEKVTIYVGDSYEYNLTMENCDESLLQIFVSDSSVIAYNKQKCMAVAAGTSVITLKYLTLETSVAVEVLSKEEPVTYTIHDSGYWTNLYQDTCDDVIMTTDEILQVNELIYNNYSVTKVMNIKKASETVTKAYVQGLIENYSNINKYTVYHYDTGVALTTTEKEELLNNRNLNDLNSEITVQYGIITTFTSVRSYPGNVYSSTKEMDRFQETGLAVGEGILIYHYSKDGKYAFVQAENYNGWIKVSDFGKTTKEIFNQYLNSSNFVIVSKEHLLIDNVYLRLSNKLPYESKTSDSYNILLPTRDADGCLKIVSKTVSSEGLHDGYFSYTYRNIIELGLLMENTPYRWGDYDKDGRDCSSTQNAIFKCFGFDMPRNTSNQRKIPNYGASTSMSVSKLKTYKPGTMIFTSSHVMLYIGNDADGNPYLLHNSGYCKLQKASDYGMGNIIATLSFNK